MVEDRIWHRATVRILPAQLTACALFTAVQVHTAGVAAGREDGLPDASSRACTCRRCTRGRMDSYASPEGQGWPGLGALRASLSDAEVGSPGGYPSPQALFQDPSSPHAPCGTVTRRMDKMCTLYTVFLYIHTHRYARVTQRARAAGNLAAAQGRRRRLADKDCLRRGCERVRVFKDSSVSDPAASKRDTAPHGPVGGGRGTLSTLAFASCLSHNSVVRKSRFSVWSSLSSVWYNSQRSFFACRNILNNFGQDTASTW